MSCTKHRACHIKTPNKYELLLFLFTPQIWPRGGFLFDPSSFFVALAKPVPLARSLVLLLSILCLKVLIRVVTKFLQHLFTLK